MEILSPIAGAVLVVLITGLLLKLGILPDAGDGTDVDPWP